MTERFQKILEDDFFVIWTLSASDKEENANPRTNARDASKINPSSK